MNKKAFLFFICFLSISILSFAQDKIVLNNGTVFLGLVWDINKDGLMFLSKDGSLSNYSPDEVSEVYLDENESKAMIKKIKKGSQSGYQRGKEAAEGRVGMGLLNFGVGIISGTTGVIPINGLQTEEMIRQEVDDYSGPDKIEYQAGYVQAVQKKNRRAFSLGFIGGVISSFITNPSPGFGTGRIGF